MCLPARAAAIATSAISETGVAMWTMSTSSRVEQLADIGVSGDLEGRGERLELCRRPATAAATSAARGYSGSARASPYAEYQCPSPITATLHVFRHAGCPRSRRLVYLDSPCFSREPARPRCFSSPPSSPSPASSRPRSIARGRRRFRRYHRIRRRLSPADALKTFYMPPGYRIELVASEPLVQDPIVMDWDRQGRIWVVEMPGFVPNLEAPEPYMEPIGKVVVLEDTDKDGVMDKRTVFADGLVLRAIAQGARSRHPGRRAAERLADARHQRRPEDGHQGVDHRPVRPPRGARRAEHQRLLLGRWTTGCTPPTRTPICG